MPSNVGNFPIKQLQLGSGQSVNPSLTDLVIVKRANELPISVTLNRLLKPALDGMAIPITRFGASTTISDNRTAIQDTINSLPLTGGAVFIPPGTWTVLPSSPIIVPSNVTIFGIRGQSIISVNHSGYDPVANPKTYPDAKDSVFCCGNPTTGNRAAIVSSGTNPSTDLQYDSATFVQNVHFLDFSIHGTLTATPGGITASWRLTGIDFFGVRIGSISGMHIKNMLNTGVVTDVIENVHISDCIFESCGNFHTFATTRNGLSVTGALMPLQPSFRSKSVVVSNVVSINNKDAGIQYAGVKGIVISGCHITGNGDRGIEGDNYLVSEETESSLGDEIPCDSIITDNYIDTEPGSVAMPYGITVLDGNQGRVLIANNTIKNATLSGIIVQAKNDATVTITGNTLENINSDGDNNYHAITVRADHASITNNTLVNVYAGNAIQALYYGRNIAITGNRVVSTTASNTLKPRSFIGVSFVLDIPTIPDADVIDISSNTLNGCRDAAIQLDFNTAALIKALNVHSNTVTNFNMNTAKAGANEYGFIRFNRSSGASTIRYADIALNSVYKQTPNSDYPLAEAGSGGSITFEAVYVHNNNFAKAATFPYPNWLIDNQINALDSKLLFSNNLTSSSTNDMTNAGAAYGGGTVVLTTPITTRDHFVFLNAGANTIELPQYIDSSLPATAHQTTIKVWLKNPNNGTPTITWDAAIGQSIQWSNIADSTSLSAGINEWTIFEFSIKNTETQWRAKRSWPVASSTPLAVRPIYQNHTTVSHTDIDTNWTELRSYTIPGGLMKANDSLRITMRFSNTPTTVARTYRMYFDGLAGSDIFFNTTQSNATHVHLAATIMLSNRNATNSQISNPDFVINAAGSLSNLNYFTFTKDMTTDKTLRFGVAFGTAGVGTLSITMESIIIELIPGV